MLLDITCTHCKETKSRFEFKFRIDHYEKVCKTCMRAKFKKSEAGRIRSYDVDRSSWFLASISASRRRKNG